MIFDSSYIREADESAAVDPVKSDVDAVAGTDGVDPNSAEGVQAAAEEVERAIQAQALESMTYFEGGEEALKKFTESAEVQALVEARKMAKHTFVRLNKTDDLQRRTNLACLVLARAHKDPLWTKLAANRRMERKLRNAIYAKFKNKAAIVARKSQQVHIKAMRKQKDTPIRFM